MTGSNKLSETEIDLLIKLLREDYLATKINVDAGLVANLDIESLAEYYKSIKDKLDILKS